MDLGWVGMNQVWSEKVRSTKWTSRLTSRWTSYFKVDFTPHNSKVKSHLKFTELDINASQACLPLAKVNKVCKKCIEDAK